MNAIYALFAKPDGAQRAVNLLEREGTRLGVVPQKIEVLSSVPLEDCEIGRRQMPSVMPWLAALGGVAGGTTTYLFVTSVQRAFPVVTGGMSITPIWTNGIIVYEMTMLGAILATLVTLLLAVRLPNWRERLYDPAISDGLILVGVSNPPEGALADIENVFRQAGASEIKKC
jgi:ActD protein